MKNLVVALLASLVSIFANANPTNWVHINTSTDKKVFGYIDIESISIQGNYKQAFIKTTNTAWNYYTVALTLYDCKSNPKKFKNTYLVVYNLNGNVITSGMPTDYGFYPTVPESLNKIETDFVCNF